MPIPTRTIPIQVGMRAVRIRMGGKYATLAYLVPGKSGSENAHPHARPPLTSRTQMSNVSNRNLVRRAIIISQHGAARPIY